MTKAQNTSK